MAQASDFGPRQASVPALIGIGTSLSGLLDLFGCNLVAIQMPAAWTAAAISFQVSADGVTFGNLYKSDGSEYSVTAVAANVVTLPEDDFAGFRYLKVRSGLNGAAVNQLADRTLTLIVRPTG